jgi:hypothetical protein
VVKLVEVLAADQKRLSEFRQDFEALASEYFADNQVHQDFLLSRGIKV